MPFIAWAALALMVASYAIQAVLIKKPPEKGAANIDDFDVPQVEEGTPHAVVFGDGWIEGWQVVWYGNYRTSKIKAKSGGKGK
jgi:hypothetical protein